MHTMHCPQCHCEIPDSDVIRYSASLISRMAPPESRARDPEKMSAAGKLGGWPKGRPRYPKGAESYHPTFWRWVITTKDVKCCRCGEDIPKGTKDVIYYGAYPQDSSRVKYYYICDACLHPIEREEMAVTPPRPYRGK
jgi:hypothetical protein